MARASRRLGRILVVALASSATGFALIGVLWRVCYPLHPTPLGKLGSGIGCVRARLPAMDASDDALPRPMVQVIYPAPPRTDLVAGCLCAGTSSYFRREVIDALAELTGMPNWFAQLSLRRPQVDAPRIPEPPLGQVRGENRGWPVVIFSSGLHGSLEMYTQLGREVAALGAIFLAIEHEDGSGLYAVDARSGQPIPYTKPPAGYTGRRAELVRFRQPQLKTRVAELYAVVAYLRRAALNPEVGEAQASLDQNSMLLRQVVQFADPESIVIMGHSFGAAGVVLALQNGLRRYTRGAVLFDPWLSVISERRIRGGMPVPYAVFISEEWDGFPHEMRHLRQLLQGSSRGVAIGAIRVAGTRHQWIADSTLWLPRPILRRLGSVGPGDCGRAHAATVRAVGLALEELLGTGRTDETCDGFPRASSRRRCRSPRDFACLGSHFESLDPEILHARELSSL